MTSASDGHHVGLAACSKCRNATVSLRGPLKTQRQTQSHTLAKLKSKGAKQSPGQSRLLCPREPGDDHSAKVNIATKKIRKLASRRRRAKMQNK